MTEHDVWECLDRRAAWGACGHEDERQIEDEQERRWAALDASVPCSHWIPGTCDYC